MHTRDHNIDGHIAYAIRGQVFGCQKLTFERTQDNYKHCERIRHRLPWSIHTSLFVGLWLRLVTTKEMAVLATRPMKVKDVDSGILLSNMRAMMLPRQTARSPEQLRTVGRDLQ